MVIAVYLIIIGMHFIGLTYLLVYVGAIAILFLFVVMLINVRTAELTSYTSNSLPLAIIFSMVIYIAFYSSDSGLIGSELDIDLSTSHK
jgi:NADH-ubiquinone oxidoreductase chain 6